MKKLWHSLVLACLLSSGVQAQAPPAEGHWVGTQGSQGLELRLDQEGPIVTGYGDMAVGSSAFLVDVGGRVNNAGGAVLTLETDVGAPYDEVTVALTFQGNTAQAQVIAENGQSLGNFTLTRQSDVAPKLWDNVLPVLNYFDTVEEYFFRPFGVSNTIDTRLQGVFGTEVVGRWESPNGIRKPFIATYHNGTAAAWNPLLVPGDSLLVFKDSSTILDLGGAFFRRFSDGNPGVHDFRVPFGRPLYAPSGIEKGNVEFKGR